MFIIHAIWAAICWIWKAISTIDVFDSILGRLGYRREHSLSRRDPLSNFYGEAVKKLGMDHDGADIVDFSFSLCQAGSDGAVIFYGIELPIRGAIMPEHDARTRPVVEIPRVIFKDHWIDFTSIVNGRDNIFTGLYKTSDNGRHAYSNIHVDHRSALRWLRKDARAALDSKKRLRRA